MNQMKESNRAFDPRVELKQQVEITSPQQLLDDEGHLLAPGYCKRNHFRYNKESIKRHRWRIKEWDFYLVSDGRNMVEVNFYNISIFACLTATFIDMQTGERFCDFVLEPSHPNKYELSPAADAPYSFSYKHFGRKVEFVTGDSSHDVYFEGKCKGKPFLVELSGTRQLDQESLTVATPFDQPHCFFYTQKLNCIQVSGQVEVAGRTIEFDPKHATMVIDWGRGIWPWRSTWYWSNGSTLIDGKPFGFELTWGFGNTDAATETAVFYDGYCHKIGSVALELDPEKTGWMAPWHFVSSDDRLDLTMTPVYRRKNGMLVLGLIGMQGNQIFGSFNGHVILDDGTRLEVRDLPAFAEKVHTGW